MQLVDTAKAKARHLAGCASALLTLLVSGGHCQLLLAEQRDSTETIFRNATGFSFTFCIIICPISSFTTWTCTGSSLDHPHAGNPVGAHVHGGAALEQAAVGGCDTAVPFSCGGPLLEPATSRLFECCRAALCFASMFPPEFCVDNGAMIAWLGIERIQSFGLSAVFAPDAVHTCFALWPLGNQASVS